MARTILLCLILGAIAGMPYFAWQRRRTAPGRRDAADMQLRSAERSLVDQLDGLGWRWE